MQNSSRQGLLFYHGFSAFCGWSELRSLPELKNCLGFSFLGSIIKEKQAVYLYENYK
jgi:hypothetical protein